MYNTNIYTLFIGSTDATTASVTNYPTYASKAVQTVSPEPSHLICNDKEHELPNNNTNNTVSSSNAPTIPASPINSSIAQMNL